MTDKKPVKNSVPFTVVLTQENYDKLKKQAQEGGYHTAQYARLLIERGLKK